MRHFQMDSIAETIEHDILRNALRNFKSHEENKIRLRLSTIEQDKAIDIVRAVMVANDEIQAMALDCFKRIQKKMNDK